MSVLRSLTALLVVFSVGLTMPPAAVAADPTADLATARALFEANLEAIRQRDRDAYLACYLQSDNLARSGPGGLALGFEGLAASAGEGWPDHFDAQDLQLVPISPGLVYGTYRYRVRYGDDEAIGLSERLFRQTADGWRIAVTTAFPHPAEIPPPPLALVGASLIDGTGAAAIDDAVVIVRGGRIDCVGRRADCPIPEGLATVDRSGSWIVPGLVDAHVHFAQTGWADGRPDSLDLRDRHPYAEVQAQLRAQPQRFFRAFLCAGITAVFDVGGYPWTWEVREKARNDRRAPHVAAAGPLLSTLDFWLNLPAERQFVYLADRQAAATGVDYLVSHETDAVKIWFIATSDRETAELDEVVRAAGAAARESQVPLIVHATNLREARVAVEAGASLLVHSVWDQPVDDAFIELLRERRVVYSPTLTVRNGYQRMWKAAAAGSVPEIDDPNSCVDQETRAKVASTPALDPQQHQQLNTEALVARDARLGREQRIAADNLLRLQRAGVVIATGTDAGNPLTLHGPSIYAEMEAMQAAGLSPMEVLVASTRGGAMAMGREKEIGTLEAGKIADLVVVAADPTADIENMRQLHQVMRGGELRPLAELRAPPP